MSEPLLFLLPPLALVAGMSIGHIIIKRQSAKRERFYGIDFAEPPKPKVDMFCVDCGKMLVSLRSQKGFNGKTGQPIYEYVRACNDAHADPHHSSHTHWPFCGKRTNQAGIPNAHNHEGEAMNLACPACLDVMVANAGIDPKEAMELYLKSGVKEAERPANDWFTAPFIGGSGGSIFPASFFTSPPKTRK